VALFAKCHHVGEVLHPLAADAVEGVSFTLRGCGKWGERPDCFFAIPAGRMDITPLSMAMKNVPLALNWSLEGRGLMQ
jgi:hypothetical protein